MRSCTDPMKPRSRSLLNSCSWFTLTKAFCKCIDVVISSGLFILQDFCISHVCLTRALIVDVFLVKPYCFWEKTRFLVEKTAYFGEQGFSNILQNIGRIKRIKCLGKANSRFMEWNNYCLVQTFLKHELLGALNRIVSTGTTVILCFLRMELLRL